MKTAAAYIESGILELYVLGMTNEAESLEVERLRALHSEVRAEIDAISKALLVHAEASTAGPNPTIRAFVMAMVDFSERVQNGEAPSFPPELNDTTTLSDFEAWTSRPDMVMPDDFQDYYARIIGHTPAYTTAIVWINDMAPPEVHHDEVEKFLILEGTCDITIGDTVHHFAPGDYVAMPLHLSHTVKVTSEIPCKVILQRIAA